MIQHSLHGHFAVRNGPWKLIPSRGSGGFTSPNFFLPPEGEPPGQLYHLEDDPGEQQNLYAERPTLVRMLADLLATERAR